MRKTACQFCGRMVSEEELDTDRFCQDCHEWLEEASAERAAELERLEDQYQRRLPTRPLSKFEVRQLRRNGHWNKVLENRPRKEAK